MSDKSDVTLPRAVFDAVVNVIGQLPTAKVFALYAALAEAEERSKQKEKAADE